MKRYFVLFTIMCGIVSSCNKSMEGEFLVTKFGAREGENQINTEAIQEAINTCHEKGGGKVIIPPGTWYSGTLVLLSNVNLYLEAGTVLKGSGDINDYGEEGFPSGLLYAFNQENISITGDGEICGNGTSYHDPSRAHDAGDFDRKYIRQGESYMQEGFDFSDGPIWKGKRPENTVTFINCENINLRDIRISDTPSWAVKFADCDNVIVRGISIFNNLLIPNSDGIHTTHSRNITISDCDIRAGDDAIIVTGFDEDAELQKSLKELDDSQVFGNKHAYAENISVTNCILQSRSAGIRVGYGVYPIRNCIFSNLVIYDSNRGIGVFARDNATIENIIFDNIIIRNRLHSGHWWGNGEPIHVSTIPQKENIPGGDIKNIRFSNIIADSETGIIIWGSEYNRIRDIQLNNVQLTIHKGNLDEEYGGNIDLRPAFPDSKKIFSFDLPGLYIQHSDEVSIRDFKLIWEIDVAEYFTHGIHLKDVSEFFIDSESKYPSRPGSGLSNLRNE